MMVLEALDLTLMSELTLMLMKRETNGSLIELNLVSIMLDPLLDPTISCSMLMTTQMVTTGTLTLELMLPMKKEINGSWKDSSFESLNEFAYFN